MNIPILRGLIRRRLLVNFRAAPEALIPMLPAPFRPKVVHGAGMVGICLIRLEQIRPRFLPSALGLSSENAAHRVAVEWDEDGAVREGVYIWRRDTDSRFNALVGGRIFPGIHHHSRFAAHESDDRVEVAFQSDDARTRVLANCRLAEELPATSRFTSLEEASNFFRRGSFGYSPTNESAQFHGLELCCRNWNVVPLEAEEVFSSFFQDVARFPAGAIEFDSALLMRGIEHEWRATPAPGIVGVQGTACRAVP